MRKILAMSALIAVACVLLGGWQQQGILVPITGAQAPAGCTTPSNHLYDQGFESAFPLTGFTVVGSPTSGTALTGTPPIVDCSNGFAVASAATADYAYYDWGSHLNVHYFRLDFQVTSSSVASGDAQTVYSFQGVSTPGSQKTFRLMIANTAGTLSLVYDTSTTTTLVTPFVLNTWYIVTGLVDTVTPANSFIKINNGVSIPVSPTTGNDNQFLMPGTVFTGRNIALQIGYLGINNTEISGANVSNP